MLLRFLSGSVLAAMGDACGGIFALGHGFLAASRLNYLLAAFFAIVVLLQLAFLLGGGMRLLRASHGLKQLRRLDARHCPAMPPIVRKQWAKRIFLMQSGKLEALTVGLLRPRILIARAMTDALSGSDLAAVVAHEEAHCRGRDNLMVAIAKAVSLTLFYLPGPRMAFRMMRSSLEKAADRKAATAAGSSLAVASALARIARAGRPANTGQLAVEVIGNGDLTERLEELVHGDHGVRKASWRRLTLFAVGAAMSLALFSSSALSVASADQRGAFICFTEHQQGAGPDGICLEDHPGHAKPGDANP